MIHAIIILSNIAFFGWVIWMAKPLVTNKYTTIRTGIPKHFLEGVYKNEQGDNCSMWTFNIRR